MRLVNHLQIKESTNNVLFIGGPTASGKTGLAIRIAKDFYEQSQLVSVISADSRQIYKDMTICTAKPVVRDNFLKSDELYLSPIKYDGIDHYLFDIVEPNDRYSLFDFKAQAESLIHKLQSEGHKVIVAGGTGLYMDSLIYNYQLNPIKSYNSKVKQALAKDYEDLLKKTSKDIANATFWNKLNDLDEIEAQKINKNNWQGVLRSIEVHTLTNKSKSSQNSKSEPEFEYQMLILDPPRQDLYDYINKRCADMFEEGMIEETKYLLQNYNKDIPAMTSIGYNQVQQLLNQEISKEEALQSFQKATRNYAKRQMTWFRRYKTNPHTQFIDSYKLLK